MKRTRHRGVLWMILQKNFLYKKIEKRKQLITVNTRYCGPLKEGEYSFNFNGANFGNCKEVIEEYKDFKGLITGFIIPHSGYIKKNYL